jgi:hypothetical protein
MPDWKLEVQVSFIATNPIFNLYVIFGFSVEAILSFVNKNRNVFQGFTILCNEWENVLVNLHDGNK